MIEEFILSESYQNTMLYIRLVAYPFISYSLFILAFSGKSSRDARSTFLHLLFSAFFLWLFGNVVIRLVLGTEGSHLISIVNNIFLPPILVVIVCAIWRVAYRGQEKEIEEKSPYKSTL